MWSQGFCWFGQRENSEPVPVAEGSRCEQQVPPRIMDNYGLKRKSMKEKTDEYAKGHTVSLSKDYIACYHHHSCSPSRPCCRLLLLLLLFIFNPTFILLSDHRCWNHAWGSCVLTRVQHATTDEINPGCSQLVKPLVGDEHLAEGLIAIGAMPGLLDSSYMSRLHDGGANSSRHSELLNEVVVVGKRVLPWEREASGLYTWCTKDFPKGIKLCEGGVEGFESFLVKVSMMGNVTNIKEWWNCLGHFWRNMTSYGWYINLQ